MKKILATILTIALCMGNCAVCFAAEQDVMQETAVVENYSAPGDTATPNAVSGYGQASNLSNTSGSFNVKVTKDWWNNGYGLTFKTSGSGTAVLCLVDPDGNRVPLCASGFNCYEVQMTDTAERAWNLSGIKSGTYKVKYTVMGGPMKIVCHIYG